MNRCDRPFPTPSHTLSAPRWPGRSTARTRGTARATPPRPPPRTPQTPSHADSTSSTGPGHTLGPHPRTHASSCTRQVGPGPGGPDLRQRKPHPVPSAQCPAPSTQCPVPSAQRQVPSAQCPVSSAKARWRSYSLCTEHVRYQTRGEGARRACPHQVDSFPMVLVLSNWMAEAFCGDEKGMCST